MKMEVISDSDSSQLNPPTIIEATKVSSWNFLPKTSKEKYEIAYKAFMDWRKENKLMSLSENVLMAYFEKISSKFKPTTLWVHYSMLRTTLNIYNNVDIEQYLIVKEFIKKQSKGYQPKKSKTLTSSQINTFIKEAPEKEYLLTKVVLIMGVMGACRRHELYQMTMSNLEDLGSAVIVTTPNTETTKSRRFTITGDFYNMFKKYADLRPPHVQGSYFFVNYQKGKCTIQRVGINKFGHMGKQIAKYLNLSNPELYTGHCFRRSSATILTGDDTDEDKTTFIKIHGGWDSTTLTERKTLTSTLKRKCTEQRDQRECEEINTVLASSLQDMGSAMKTVIEDLTQKKNEDRDEDDVFGELVASTLKKMNNPKKKKQIKKQIINDLLDYSDSE